MAQLRHKVFSVVLLLTGLGGPLASHAVETAPRISDREIIESLAELKAGQKSLQQQIDGLKQSTQQQFDQLREEMNQRFKAVDQRFDDMNRRIDGRFDDMNRSIDGRFDDLNRRFDDLMALMQILIGVLVAVLGSILAWLVVIWRRLARVEKQEHDIQFLKEGFNHLQGIVTQIMAKLP